jgi:hypothetical protein
LLTRQTVCHRRVSWSSYIQQGSITILMTALERRAACSSGPARPLLLLQRLSKTPLQRRRSRRTHEASRGIAITYYKLQLIDTESRQGHPLFTAAVPRCCCCCCCSALLRGEHDSRILHDAPVVVPRVLLRLDPCRCHAVAAVRPLSLPVPSSARVGLRPASSSSLW